MCFILFSKGACLPPGTIFDVIRKAEVQNLKKDYFLKTWKGR